MSTDVLSPADTARIQRTFAALRGRGVEPILAGDRTEALRLVLGLIPPGAAVAHGSSMTLKEIGLVDYLGRPDAPYRYLNAEWLAENDPERRARLRARLSAEADYFLGSVQAITEDGRVIGADGSGSRQAFYVFGPPRVIWVAGINKLVPTLEDGFRRLHEVAVPLEDARIRQSGGSGTRLNKIVIYEGERPGRISLVLVGEPLGF